MPYIITTLDTARHGEPMEDQSAADVDGATRTAVATLEEARDKAHEAVHAAYRAAYPVHADGRTGEHSDAQRAHRWRNIEISNLPESGGTVGPLPDGTVIEVRQVTLAELAGSPVANYNPAHPTDVIAAFNAV
jgi:hypothetical protein